MVQQIQVQEKLEDWGIIIIIILEPPSTACKSHCVTSAPTICSLAGKIIYLFIYFIALWCGEHQGSGGNSCQQPQKNK